MKMNNNPHILHVQLRADVISGSTSGVTGEYQKNVMVM
ncbi:hypothetical protein ECBCE008MS01_0512 [Escherichia coli BCE008_MS-01]|nr:hypothetical protein ECBCE008MS01_0512 [Escherichia coli BCE008_MS-01]